MPDPSIQVHGVTPAPQRLVVDGYVSTVQPAPKSFSDSLYVTVPEMSGDVPLGPCEWMEGHGTALPARGAKVVVVFDEREVPVIVWWEGEYVEPAPTDSGWLAPTLLNSWAQQAGRIAVGYRKQGNVVRLRGSLWGGSSGAVAFLLPAGFRPTGTVFDSSGGIGSSGASATSVLVTQVGEVGLYFSSGATQAAVDGVTFTTD